MATKKQVWLKGVREWAADAQIVFENLAKTVIVIGILVSMVVFGFYNDPGPKAPFADRILAWSFAVFAVGLAELFVLFVILSVLGKIDLAGAFYDKPAAGTPVAREDPSARSGDAAADDDEGEQEDQATARKPATAKQVTATTSAQGLALAETPSVSLSRLQAFMWTLVVLTIYFHRVVKDEENGLPTIPAELLMVMGISGATFLISKGISASAQQAPVPPAAPQPPAPPKPPAPRAPVPLGGAAGSPAPTKPNDPESPVKEGEG